MEHASGRLVIDLSTALIVSETENPYRLPWPTQDGQLEAIPATPTSKLKLTRLQAVQLR